MNKWGSRQLFKYIPTASILLFFTLPMSFPTRDMWDTTIAHSGVLLGNMTGWDLVASESGWDLSFSIFQVQQFISSSLHIPFQVMTNVYMTLLLGVICYSAVYIAKSIFGLSPLTAAFVGATIPIIPVWSAVLSSAMSAQMLLLTSGIAGVLVFRTKSRFVSVLGFGLVVFSFEMSALLLWLPVVSYALDVLKQNRKLPSLQTYLTGMAGVIYFGLQKIFDPPTGVYADISYNSFELFKFGAGFVNASTFLLIPVFVLTVGWFLSDHRIYEDSGMGVSRKKPFISWLFAGALFISAFVPHSAVGKSNSIFRVFEWDTRFNILLSVSTGILVGLAGGYFGPRVRVKLRWLWCVSLALGALILIWLSFWSFAMNISQQYFSDNLVHSIHEKVPDGFPNGEIYITGAGIPGSFATYESNYLFQREYGDPNWWVNIIDRAPVPNRDTADPYIYRDVYIPKGNPCTTRIEVEVNGYKGMKNQFLNLLHLNKSAFIKISNIATDCN